ncbi:porin [Caenimonas aquaedulcis]|uniref:Porin n=1 Tax=Caenimonas aquaedulcis TaxID=2793270 RepID=A0A931MIT9_9BURK|nr:porin [Caenimonas aquaedulcis]MBG9390496.1 porin [Caenimonas aquaedulcis]
MINTKPCWFVGLPALLACALGHAQSTVQIYGTIDEFAGRLTTETATTRSSSTVLNNGGMTTSFLGFRGTEDLGGGLRAVFALETFIRADTGAIGRNDADPFWGRLSIVGLEGGWGKLTLGRHVTPYSLATTLNTPFVGSTTLSPVFAHVYNLNLQGGTRFDNGVQYSLPRLGGFAADFLYSMGRENATPSVDRKRDRAFEAVGSYTTGPAKLTAGYHYINLNNAGDDHDQNAWMVAGTYDFGVIKVNAQHHRVREQSTTIATNARRRTTEAGVTIPVGAGSILATYVRSSMRDASPATPDGRRSFSIGYDYNLSKRTDIYTAYYRDRLVNPMTQQTILAAGVRHRF